MLSIEFIRLIGLIALGLITCYTDFKYKKAFNNHLFFFLIVGVVLLMIAFFRNSDSVLLILINYTIVVITGVLFYWFDVWAAGDAKLYIIMSLFVPLSIICKNVVVSPILLIGMIFSLAFVYVVMESVVLICLEIVNKQFNWKSYLKFPRQSLIYILAVFTVVDTIDALLNYSGAFHFISIPGAVQLFNFLLILLLLTLIRENMISLPLLLLLTMLKLGVHVFFSLGVSTRALSIIIMVLLTTILKNITGKFNYREINTKDVSQGMVLSQMTILLMSRSSVKGLPKYTDETTRYRISETEAEAIKRWEKSKYGESNIVIVRTIPFAPFIFAGTLVFFVISLL